MPIETFPLGPLETNCYLVYRQSDAIVVDPGGDPAPVLQFLQDNNLRLQAILITHRHFDHIFGVADLHKATLARVYVPAGDDVLREVQDSKGGIWGFPEVPPFDSEDLPLGEHDFGCIHCQVLHTPGHTPGSISLYLKEEQTAITGDLLFYRSVGRTDFTGGSTEQLLESIRTKIYTLPPETCVLPGHGLATKVLDEYNNNPYCGAFTR